MYISSLVAGPDGKLYVADGSYDGTGGYIDQISIAGGAPTGVVSVPLPSRCQAYGVTPAYDGNVWFSDSCANLGRVSPNTFASASMAEWQMVGVTDDDYFYGLISTPGGLWVTDDSTDTIYRITNLTGAVAWCYDRQCMHETRSAPNERSRGRLESNQQPWP